jgi:hypothetical protein
MFLVALAVLHLRDWALVPNRLLRFAIGPRVHVQSPARRQGRGYDYSLIFAPFF